MQHTLVRALALLVLAPGVVQACREPSAQSSEALAVSAGQAGAAGQDGQPPEPPRLHEVSVDLPRARTAELDPQFQTQWCWAATIANVFAYHGHPVSQSRIVKEAYGVVKNVTSGPYANIAALLDRDWEDDRGERFSSRVVGALDLMAGIQTVNNDTLRQSLENDDPVVVATTSHAMLVVGMTFMGDSEHVHEVQSVQVFDPWPSIGFRELTPAEQTPSYHGGKLMFLARVTVLAPDAGTGE